MLRRAAIVLGLVAAIFVITSPARAHDPIFFTGDQTTPETGPFLPDGTVSFALYGRLDAPGDSRGFQVEFAAGDPLLIELLIPDRPPENTYGDGDLPAVSVTAPDGSTFDLLAEMREPFDEPFSGTSYVGLSRVEGEAHAGIYDVLVTGEVPTRFTIAVGTTESFFTPVDRVENRVASFADITGPLAAWYDVPPDAAGGEPGTPPTAADAATTTVAAPTTTTTTTADPATTTTTAQAAAAPLESSGGGGVGIVVAAGAGLALAATVVALWRSRRRTAAD